MDLNHVRDLAIQKMTEHGLIASGWTFAFDTTTNRMGVCKYRTRTIAISRLYAAEATQEQVLNTILHEVAHALTPGAKHGPVWKAKAVQLGATPRACGANPYHSRVQGEKIAAAKTTITSASETTAHAGDFAPGTRVVVQASNHWGGRVLVIVDKRRTRYLCTYEGTDRPVAVPATMLRAHVEGEDLNFVASGRRPRPQTSIPTTRTVATTRAKFPRGSFAKINFGRFNGTLVEVIRPNQKTCTVRTVPGGLELSVSIGGLTPAKAPVNA